jgi:hypothetical protein
MSMLLLTVVEFLVFAYISGFAADRYGMHAVGGKRPGRPTTSPGCSPRS